ncbi:MAG: RidA family protein [Candidatus Odinarchaeota archaeon]|nr:RidA family protein [Candidatus Odinarchaeota archaeon]
MSFDEKLKKLGIELPVPSKPVASYVPALTIDNFIYVSGQLPIKNGKLIFKGKLGKELSVEDGYKAAEICAINILAQLKAKLGTLDKIEQIIKVEGYVASVPEFTEHSKVINGASDLFLKIFGEKGKHTRIAVGMASLPLNAPVEISLVAKIKRE